MALFPMYFSPLSPAQANPFGYGLQQGTAIAGQNLENVSRGIQNALMNAQVPYAGQMAQANLALKQAQVPLTQSEAALNIGTLPYLGYKFLSPYLAAQANLLKAGTGVANSYNTAANSVPGSKIFSNNPALQKAYQTNLENQAQLIANGITGGGLTPPSGSVNTNSLSGYSTLPVANTGLPGQPISAAQQANLARLLQPQQSELQDAFQSNYINKTTPHPVLQQRYYDQSVNNMLGQVAPIMPDVSNFAGLAGKANQAADKYAQAAGLATSPMYRNFKTFTDEQAPILANEIRRALGGHATDKEQEMMADIANPVAWNKDPQQVMQEFNALQGALHANSMALTQSPAQNLSTLQNTVQQAPATANPVASPQSAAVQIPTFANKQQFQSWYSNLAPQQQAAVRMHLGGK